MVSPLSIDDGRVFHQDHSVGAVCECMAEGKVGMAWVHVCQTPQAVREGMHDLSAGVQHLKSSNSRREILHRPKIHNSCNALRMSSSCSWLD